MCEHNRLVELFRGISKCTICGEIVDDRTDTEEELEADFQRRLKAQQQREARRQAIIKRNHKHKKGHTKW